MEQQRLEDALEKFVIVETKGEYSEAHLQGMISRIGHIEIEILEALVEAEVVIKLINFPIIELREYAMYKGKRFRHNDYRLWDDMDGVGSNPAVAIIGRSRPGNGHGAINLELHEVGDLVDSYALRREFAVTILRK